MFGLSTAVEKNFLAKAGSLMDVEKVVKNGRPGA